MALRASWEERFLIAAQTTGISTASDFTAGDIGISNASIYAVPLNNRPHFNPGQNIIDRRKAIGISTRRTGAGFEYDQGTREPTVTYELDANPYNLALLFWGLFQGGASEADGTPFKKTYIPYTAADCEVWFSLLRKMSASTGNSHAIHGAIPRSIRLSADAGGPLVASVDFIGHTWLDTFNATSVVETYAEKAPLLWQNAGSVAGLYVATTEVHMRGFDLTISNNATPVYYDAVTPEKYVLGDLTVEGNIYVPWSAATVGANTQLDNFVNGTDTLLKIWWGTYAGATEGDVSLQVNMRYTGAEVGGEPETELALPFVHAYDGTNDISFTCADAYDMSIS